MIIHFLPKTDSNQHDLDQKCKCNTLTLFRTHYKLIEHKRFDETSTSEYEFKSTVKLSYKNND